MINYMTKIRGVCAEWELAFLRITLVVKRGFLEKLTLAQKLEGGKGILQVHAWRDNTSGRGNKQY
jgi:hypothetical protein